MDPHNNWYTPNQRQYRQNSHQQPQEQTPVAHSRNFANAANQQVQHAQQLLATYPMASVGPTVHVARHLSSLNITAAPPSYVQPTYYSSQPHPGYASGSQQPPPPYNEYNQQLSHLHAPQIPSNQRSYWDGARDTSVRSLNEQAMQSYNFQPPRHQQQDHWPQSTYQTPPFAQEVFQQTMPTHAYPTPPPKPTTNTYTSSLAFALGPPVQQQYSQPVAHHPPPPISNSMPNQAPPPPNPNPVHKPYTAADSHAFFNTFVDSKVSLLHGSAPAPAPRVAKSQPRPKAEPVMHLPPPAAPRTPPPTTKQKILDSSPDPLSLGGNSPVKRPTATAVSVAVTPQKRKPVVEIQTPSAKRMQHYKPISALLNTPSTSAFGTPRTPGTAVPPLTPSTSSKTNASAGSSKSTSFNFNFGPSSSKFGAVTPTPTRVNRAYILIPPSPYSTPSSSRKGLSRNPNETPDLGGYGSEEDPLASPTRRKGTMDSAVKSSVRRTGDRDERGPLQKFVSTVEEIFEMEDSMPVEATIHDLPDDWFSPLTVDISRPMLSTVQIRKLTKLIGQVARPSKRMRQATGGNLGVLATPGGKRTGRMFEVDLQLLSRLLKTLDRSVKAGEELDPFPASAAAMAPAAVANGGVSAKSSPQKKSRKGKKASSVDENGDDDELNQNLKEGSPGVAEVDLEKLTRQLDLAKESIIAADCCIALLSSDRLPKQLYSEELITACLTTIKNRLTKILYPFVEACSPDALANKLLGVSPLLVHIISKHGASLTSQDHHRSQMSELFQALSAVLPRLNALINAESVAMSDSIIIQTVYVAIGPFFVIDHGVENESSGRANSKKDKDKDGVLVKTLGKNAMRGLRLDALSLIRSIFAHHDDQRSWIIEEILTSLIKLSDGKQKAGQFRLRDGRSIRTVSALLLQLVQTSAHDVRLHARTVEKKRQNKFALKRQESFSESQGGVQQAESEPFLDEIDREEIQYYKTGLDSATKAARTIILFLNQRSGKGKATKNSNEAEYRTIFDNLIEDLLAVFSWPEWPAAGLLLSIASKYMVTSLDDKAGNAQGDSNAAKTMALDHLGVIAARIRTSALKVQKVNEETDAKYLALKSLDQIVTNYDEDGFKTLMQAHRDVAAHLCKRSFEDQSFDSARELTAATLCQELSAGLVKVDLALKDASEDDDDLNLKSDTPNKQQEKLLKFGKKLKEALRDVWKDPPIDVFETGSQGEVSRVDRVAEEIGTIQNLKHSFHPILNVVLASLNAPAIFMRTKALRALGQIVMSDANILAAANVRRGIQDGLLDSSPAVRDAAVELIGKYMIDSPEVAGDYYQKIADRMADTGLGVRKRVIKLLKSFYSVIDDTQRKIDISTRLILRMMDEDDTVKDLAIKTVEELWFPPAPLQSAMKGKAAGQANQEKSALLMKVSVIMGTAANFSKAHGASPLEDILHKIISEKEGNEAEALHGKYTEICETLIDGLVDASDLPGFTIVNCIRSIYLFSSAYPSILSGSNASTLLPYLKNASTPEEIQTTEHLLKIFRVSVPHMPKKAAKFGQELQKALQPMIIKPSGSGGSGILQEAVACMCMVIEHLTHDFALLINLLKSCNTRLVGCLRSTTPDFRVMHMLVFIVALLGEHCNFDRLRREHENFSADIDSISGGPILEHIYLLLLRIYQKFNNAQLRGRVLQCLGFLFRAQPTLMTKDQSAEIMDAIFASEEEEGRGRLLRIMQGFLVSESEKHSAKEKESNKKKKEATDVNMDELVGNTDGFADSGVSSAIVQRYLSHILKAALSTNPTIHWAALDVLTFTIKQGLAHPLQSFPVIIALETSTVPGISNRAAALHAIVNGKHASLVNTRYTISARESFDYQKKVATGPVKGYRSNGVPVALLQRWYSLVREKRQTRQDFLKAMAKVFSEYETHQATQDDVDFTRYMAENFASFEYKTQEEVFTIIKYLTTVLSTIGTQLLDVISPSHLLSHLQPAPPPPSATPSMETVAVDSALLHDGSTPMDVDQPQNQAFNAPEQVQPQTSYGGRDPIPLMRTSVIVAMVMLLKAHLKTLYSLSEDKCNKFVVGKKSAIGDKPATKRHENPISWDRLPYAVNSIHTVFDAEAQKTTFLEIWNEDGVQAEPEDEEQLLLL